MNSFAFTKELGYVLRSLSYFVESYESHMRLNATWNKEPFTASRGVIYDLYECNMK